MSNRASRFSSGGKEHSKAKRSQGTSIVRNAVSGIGNKTRDNLSASTKGTTAGYRDRFSVKNETSRVEIIRRVDLIRSELIRQVLSPGGAVFSGSDLITYINLLIQQPLMIFLYRREVDGYKYQKHFDVEKFKSSRQSLTLSEFRRDAGENERLDVVLDEILELNDGEQRLFRVFNTKYYLRCFLLDTRFDDQPFYEVKRKLESPLGIKYAYVADCLSELFSPVADEFRHYTDSFRGVIFGNIERALSVCEYIDPAINRSSITKKPNKLGGLRFDVGGLSDTGEYRYGNDVAISERLDRSIDDAAYSAGILKRNDLEASYFDKSAGNVFLLLRAYTRENRRGGAGGFKGFNFDVKFNLSKSQRSKIASYFMMLSRMGKPGYINYKGRRNECYGGSENDRRYQWSYEKNGDKERAAAFGRFAKSLDEWFWNFLKKVKDGSPKLASVRIQKLINILLSPIGSGSVSMVDPIFYYGASIYRMPFRRDGGLGRLNLLSDIYDRLGENEKRGFSFHAINVFRGRLSSDCEKREKVFECFNELRADCIRVVLFFYLSRFWSVGGDNQETLNTKIHFYPIEVGGVVVGAVGKVSYDRKKYEIQKEEGELPTLRKTWDEEVMFFNTVVFPIRVSLRIQYSNFQIDALTREFAIGLSALLAEQDEKGDVDNNTSVKIFEKKLNEVSDGISRFCPYPRFGFLISKTGEPNLSQQHHQMLDLGGVRVHIWQEKIPSVFRVLTKPVQEEQHDGARILSLRFWEVAQLYMQ